MRYRYLDDFRRGISVFAIFSYGIAVLGTPQCPPQLGPFGKNRAQPKTRQKGAIFSMMEVVSHRIWFKWIVYPLTYQKNAFLCPCQLYAPK